MMVTTIDRWQQHPARCFSQIFPHRLSSTRDSEKRKCEKQTWPIIHLVIVSGCCMHYRHQHQHWRNRFCHFVWSSHFFIFFFICTWWWKTRVHAYNDDDHDNACRYKRIVSWLIFIASNTSRRQIEPLYTYILNRILSRKCLFDSSIAIYVRMYITLEDLFSFFNFLFARYITTVPLTSSISQRTVYFTNWACDCFMLISRRTDILYIGEQKSLIIIIAGM